jgi:hypothetical protein
MSHLLRAVTASRLVRAVSVSIAMLALCGHDLQAQTSVALTVGGGSVSFPAPTAADLTAGRLDATDALEFGVTTSSEPVGSFTTRVYIRNSSATLGGGKPVADLEWRRDDDDTWHHLSTTDALVESRATSGLLAGHTWGNSIQFRIALHWTSDPPATYTGNLVITVSTTQP